MKKFLVILCTIVIFMLAINVIPPKKVIENNPFITGETLIAAHRGGKTLNPENTFMAFDASVNEYNADILEMDLCLTKDEELVVIHNLYINDNCDVEEVTNSDELYYVSDHTYEELLNFNFGYKFVSQDGTKPYENLVQPNDPNRKEIISQNNLNIVRIEDVFARYYESNPNLMYIVEIKNDGDQGFKAAKILNELLTEKFPNLHNKTVIGTFHGSVEDHLKITYPTLMRGASTKGAAGFIITEMLKVNLFNNATFTCLQIPPVQKVSFITLKLDKKYLIDRAHRRNIAVQYWTINDEEEMIKLLDLGVDAIMTDNPKLLNEVMNRA